MMRKKIENFWYYYKNYLLIALVLLISVIVGIVSCTGKGKYDISVLYMTHEYVDMTGQLDMLFSGYTDDFNGDGLENAQVITINYGTTLKEAQSAGATRSANLAAGKNVLFLVDEQNYNELKAGGFLQDISHLGQSPYLETDRFDAKASGLLSSIEGFTKTESNYYLCVRTFDSERAKTDSKYAKKYDEVYAVIKNILTFKK